MTHLADTIHPDITLGELATLHPELVRELERWHLDYCCGGGRTLVDGCTEAGLDPALVIDALSAAAEQPSTPAWASLDAAALVDHIEATHHRYLWNEFPRLEALLTKVVGVHGGRHPELVDIAECFREIRADLEPHLMKEERVLFPMIRKLTEGDSGPALRCGGVQNPIAVMMAEHDAAGELLLRLREITDGYRPPADACASYLSLFAALEELERDTHEHIHKENNRLFAMVVDLDQG